MAGRRAMTVLERLFDAERACEFEPFEAVRLLELLADEARPAGSRPEAAGGGPSPVGPRGVLLFKSHLTLSFQPSLVAQILPPRPLGCVLEDARVSGLSRSAAAIRRRYAGRATPLPVMVQNFFGLFGVHGALPVVYTRKLLDLDGDPTLRDRTTRTALRDWLDLFTNQMAGLLYEGWAKYRMPVGYLRSARRVPRGVAPPPDRVTQVLFSAVGLGTPALRGRLQSSPPGPEDEPPPPLAALDDRALLRYAGAFARGRPGAHELRAILADYFRVAVRVVPLSGQWLNLPADALTRFDGRAALGRNAVAGERVWDAGSKFRLRIGPLRYREFIGFLPDPTPIPERKGVYLLSQLTRLYVGAELDFEIQLLLSSFDVPDCRMEDVPAGELGLRLGWNTWLKGPAMPETVDDMRFDAPCETVLPFAG